MDAIALELMKQMDMKRGRCSFGVDPTAKSYCVSVSLVVCGGPIGIAPPPPERRPADSDRVRPMPSPHSLPGSRGAHPALRCRRQISRSRGSARVKRARRLFPKRSTFEHLTATPRLVSSLAPALSSPSTHSRGARRLPVPPSATFRDPL